MLLVAHILISTSPGPGSGVSNVVILVEMEPGLSYTTALYCLGISGPLMDIVEVILIEIYV